MKFQQQPSNNSTRTVSLTRCFLYTLLVTLFFAIGMLIFPPIRLKPRLISSTKEQFLLLQQTSNHANNLNNIKNNTDKNLRVEDLSKSNQLQSQQNQVQVEGQKKKTKTVAYAITVTKDGHFVDGALVLGYAARKYHSAKFGVRSSYNADLVAFVTKQVNSSRSILSKFGWKIIELDLPVKLEEIENQDYAQRMKNSGCCGADEFLKLWAYTLTDYHRVIHLDMDSIIFKNMDELYDLPYELLYTGDYNMISGSPFPPAQGGFLIVKPSLETFREFQSVIRKGDHRPGSGWGGSHIGNFWGGQTIQGIVPYYYNILHKGKALELNRCQYNCMVDNPYHKGTTKCLNRQPTCEDCRLADINKVSSAHFTICQKPWTCTFHSNPFNKVLCEQFHNKWFQLRDEYEHFLKIDTSYRKRNSRYKESKGMCKGFGDDKYIPMPVNQVQVVYDIF